MFELTDDNSDSSFQYLRQIPSLMDFLRQLALYKGRVLFVENKINNLVKECVLVCLCFFFRTNAYEAYTLIKSQSLFFNVSQEHLAMLGQWNLQVHRVRQYLQTFPQFSCHCGGSLIILERSFSQYQNIPRIVACSCGASVLPG